MMAGHAHAPTASHADRAFAVGIALNVVFVGVEALFGVLAHSVALMADAGHNLSDVLGLALAWCASILARRKPTRRYTYGLRGATTLAALANACLLLAAVGAVSWEAVQRLRTPVPSNGATIVAVAAIGVVINGVSAALFLRGQRNDLNVRGAFLHLMADAAVSLGVAGAGVVIWQTAWFWLDPAISLIVSAVIFFGTWKLLRDAVHLAMGGVPNHIDSQGIKDYLRGVHGVCDVHDLHVWALSTTEVALSVHVVVLDPIRPPSLPELSEVLRAQFAIDHATVQIEPLTSTPCERAPDEVL